MFSEMLRNESNNQKSFTENGAIAYQTSGKELLDFNFMLNSFRNMDEDEVKNRFAKVFFEDRLLAVKYVFMLGDVREGLGERRTFRICIDWLADNAPCICKQVLLFISEYTRWDNLIRLIDNINVRDYAIDIIGSQLAIDIARMSNNDSISLLAKWLPSENASSAKTKKLARTVMTELGYTAKDYRKTLSALRKHLDVVEVKMSAKEWDKIDYATVPSKANLNYNEAFLRNDQVRRLEFIRSLKTGETKINAGVLQPHEIVNKYNINWWNTTKLDETLEELWKNLPNEVIENTLVVRDGSGSMCCRTSGSGNCTCLDVATALAIYMSEHCNDEWRDKFITFSRQPKFVDLSNCSNLRDKLVRCAAENDCSNTNIEKTMRLILDTAINNNCKQEDMPTNILILSDMQFDGRAPSIRYGVGHNWDKTLFEEISKEFEEAGYKLPKIIFWNLNAWQSTNTIPMQDNELGLILCSGYSVQNMKMFMSGEINPYKILVEQINSPRYNVIEKAVRELL